MTTLTVPQTPEEKQTRRAELNEIARALGLTQNGWARRAKVNPVFASKVLSNKVNAPGAWLRLERYLRRRYQRYLKRQQRTAA